MATIFIGDVHGCARELKKLLEKVDFQPQKDRLLLTGDAFSRGPDPLRVWEYIMITEAQMVLGNHDDRLRQQLQRQSAGQNPKISKPDHRYTLDQLLPAADELLSWLAQVPLWIRDDRFLLVHAGINPEKGPSGTSRDEFLTIRNWPPSDDLETLRWHDYYKPTKKLLVFGHDAMKGLVVKKRQQSKLPYLIGLDSGCVYGKHLSAYVLEKNQIVQVKSKNPGIWS